MFECGWWGGGKRYRKVELIAVYVGYWYIDQLFNVIPLGGCFLEYSRK